MIKFFVILVISMSVYASNSPLENQGSDCLESDNLGIFFLNGVQNTYDDAQKSLSAIDDLVDLEESKNVNKKGIDNICYKTLYNQTDGLNDFIEVFAQKTRELFPEKTEDEVYQNISKYLFTRSAFLNAFNSYNNDQLLVDYLNQINDLEVQRIKNTEFTTLRTISNEVYLNLLERSVLLVSHSQGNLFANRIVDELDDKNLSEIEYRISWALSYLKEFNFVDNPKRGTWKLTKEAWKKKLVDPKEVISVFRYKYNIKHYGKLRIITESLKNKFKNMCNFLITL